MTIMYDSTTPGAIPTNAGMVAYYVDGAYAWKPLEVARFPGAIKVPVTTTGRHNVLVCDVETGDLTAAEGAAWALVELDLGNRPTLYASWSTWHELFFQLGLLKIPESAVDWWAADPTGIRHLVPGSVATQYAWPGRGSPGHFDLSVTNGTWPGTMHAVPPAPPVVAIITKPGSDTGYWLVAADGGVFAEGDAQFFGSMGGKTLSAPVVDAAAAPDGLGYALVGEDGAVYAFGSSKYEGGTN